MTEVRELAPLPNDVLTVEEVATMLKTSPKQVRRLPIPKARISPRCVRYLREDVIAFVRRTAHVRPAA
jgi:hypothetical protein